MRLTGRSAMRAAGVACALLLAGCAVSPLRNEGAPVAFAAPRPAFDVNGRLSLRRGNDALTANFHWQHQQQQDTIDLVSPTGQIVARLHGGADIASLQTADGRVETAADWNALMARALDWSLPVAGLAFWIQGTPQPGAPFRAEPGPDNEPHVLSQEGWTVVYLAFAPDDKGVPRPSRMTLSYPDVELRVAVDAWR